jgi:hypothetical protein
MLISVHRNAYVARGNHVKGNTLRTQEVPWYGERLGIYLCGLGPT